ncbi:hypothetical protein [Nocardia sp. NPDC051832]|uniref:hypothetical protein n=1 Tax=Nocardia sp. NPDC051832 TaxID=3155673 RepID=UPI0034454E7C
MSEVHDVRPGLRRVAAVSITCALALLPALGVPALAHADHDNDGRVGGETSERRGGHQDRPGYHTHLGKNGYEMHWQEGRWPNTRSKQSFTEHDGHESSWYICKRHAAWC